MTSYLKMLCKKVSVHRDWDGLCVLFLYSEASNNHVMGFVCMKRKTLLTQLFPLVLENFIPFVVGSAILPTTRNRLRLDRIVRIEENKYPLGFYRT